MADLCSVNGATQDLVNAKQTALTYFISGTQDPSIPGNSVEASRGTVYLGVGTDPLVSGKLWQKQDDGCSTNWQLVGGSGSGTVMTGSKTLFADVNRTDVYVEDGSMLRPYKTIQGAINKVIANADNVEALMPYVINIRAGSYPENVLLNSLALKDITLWGEKGTYIAPAAGNAIESSANNNNLQRLIMANIVFQGRIVLHGDTDGGNFLFSDGKVINSLLYAGTDVKNAGAFEFRGCQAYGGVGSHIFEKVTGALADQQLLDGLTLITNLANPKPVGFAFTFFALENCVTTGAINVDAGSFLQARLGSRVMLPGEAMALAGTFQAYSSFIRGNIAVAATGTFSNRGCFYDPANLVVAPGGTFDKSQTLAKVLNYPAVAPANWAAPTPDDPTTALDRLAAAVAGLLGGPIP